MIASRFPRPALIPLHSNNYWNQMYDDINFNQREFNQLYYKQTCKIRSSFDGNGFVSYETKERSRTFPSNNHNLQLKNPIIRQQNIGKRNVIKYKNNKLAEAVHLCNADTSSSQSVVEDESYFPFHRQMDCDYHEAKQETSGNWPLNTVNHGYNLTSIRNPK